MCILQPLKTEIMKFDNCENWHNVCENSEYLNDAKNCKNILIQNCKNGQSDNDHDVHTVSEPNILILFGLGLAIIGLINKRK